MIRIDDTVKPTVVPLLAVYRIGRPGIPKNAELPTADPVQEGATVDTAAVAAVLVAFRLKDRTEPSLRLNEKFCPAVDLAVVSL